MRFEGREDEYTPPMMPELASASGGMLHASKASPNILPYSVQRGSLNGGRGMPLGGAGAAAGTGTALSSNEEFRARMGYTASSAVHASPPGSNALSAAAVPGVSSFRLSGGPLPTHITAQAQAGALGAAASLSSSGVHTFTPAPPAGPLPAGTAVLPLWLNRARKRSDITDQLGLNAPSAAESPANQP